MNIIAVDVRCPGDDVARMPELLRLGAELYAENGLQSRLAGGRAKCSVQLRCAQAVKESAVHGSAIERAQRAPVGIRQDRLTAKLGRDRAPATRDLIESLIPRNALPNLFARDHLCAPVHRRAARPPSLSN